MALAGSFMPMPLQFQKAATLSDQEEDGFPASCQCERVTASRYARTAEDKGGPKERTFILSKNKLSLRETLLPAL